MSSAQKLAKENKAEKLRFGGIKPKGRNKKEIDEWIKDWKSFNAYYESTADLEAMNLKADDILDSVCSVAAAPANETPAATTKKSSKKTSKTKKAKKSKKKKKGKKRKGKKKSKKKSSE